MSSIVFLRLVESVMAAAKAAADSIMSMYVGNQPGQVPGIFVPVDVYYWWLGGAAWNVLRISAETDHRHS
jgi:mannan endo-1,6-alpha-mannosidase